MVARIENGDVGTLCPHPCKLARLESFMNKKVNKFTARTKNEVYFFQMTL
jgi:hypothetical protein